MPSAFLGWKSSKLRVQGFEELEGFKEFSTSGVQELEEFKVQKVYKPSVSRNPNP